MAQDIIKCTKCDSVVEAHHSFCPACGTRLERRDLTAGLTEGQRRQIYEEERAGDETGQGPSEAKTPKIEALQLSSLRNPRYALGWLGVLLALAAIMWVVIPSGSTTTEEDAPTHVAPAYVGGLASCQHARNVARDVVQGFLTSVELREKFKEVQQSGSTAQPEIRNASARLLRSATQGDIGGLATALDEMDAACVKYGW